VPITDLLSSQCVVFCRELATLPIIQALQQSLYVLSLLQVEERPGTVEEGTVGAVVAAHPCVGLTRKGQFPQPYAVHFQCRAFTARLGFVTGTLRLLSALPLAEPRQLLDNLLSCPFRNLRAVPDVAKFVWQAVEDPDWKHGIVDGK